MEPCNQEPIARAIRRLTIAVWALTAVFGVYVAMYLVAYLPFSFSGSSAPASSDTAPSRPSRMSVDIPDFHALPPEKQIEAASAIVIAKYEKEGDRNKCVMSEVLKLAPGTKLYYKVGDEFPHCSHDIKPNENRGDGQIMFFVGNPAQFRYSSSFSGDRLRAMGDMPIELLRKQIKESAK